MRGILAAVSVGVVLICGLSGCGFPPENYAKHEAAGKDLISAMNDIADGLETIKGKDSVKAGVAKIEKGCAKMEEVAKVLPTLPNISKADDDKLQKQLESELKKAEQRMRVATEAVGKAGEAAKDESFVAAMTRMQKAGTALQNASNKAKAK